MAIVTNTFLTLDAIGNREDLANKIYDISPTTVPFSDSIGRTRATAVLHEWQTDTLAAATSNAVVEGDDVTFAAAAATTRLNNRTQILRKEVIVSRTQNAVDSAGRNREVVYQFSKRAAEIKRDLEFTLLANVAPISSTGSTVTSRLRSATVWYNTNTSFGSTGVDGFSTSARVDGTARAVSESLLQGVLQDVFTSGGEPDTIMVGAFNKRNISKLFTGNVTRQEQAAGAALHTAIDIYHSDWGELRIVPNRFQRVIDAHILQTDMWALAELTPLSFEALAKTGDAEKGFHIMEVTLEAKNEAASGLLTDLTST